ncbi:hypothetical protein [Salsuginibacillus kocurii]|uniref:hypothetical protein n=1 Tax=Salsuginibacillus kocurii TaxID=427078 RepID=UPI00036C4749|nr:hypothetical protein [Salsuginibacillus kocurii]
MKHSMVALLSIVSLSVLVACGQGSSGQELEEEVITDDHIVAYFEGIEDGRVILDITDARAQHLKEQGADVTDSMVHLVQVEKTDELVVANSEGEAIEWDELDPHDRMYIDYDLSTYNTGQTTIELDHLILDDGAGKDELIGAQLPDDEEAYRIIIVHDEGQVLEESVEEEDFNEVLAETPLESYATVHQQDGHRMGDYVNALDIEKELPVYLILDHEGVTYKTDEAEEALSYFEDEM